MIAVGFLSGMTMLAFAGAGVFFWKFWMTARDSFFLSFAISCWLLAAERGVLVLSHTMQAPGSPSEADYWVYIIRLFAFLFIIVAIVRKNLKRR